jgi:hypothetical protein
LLCFSPSAFFAADLESARQPPPKVPASLARSWKYCLLVFGPEAKTRVWLAWDGTSIFADCTGKGDLTRPEARVTGKKWDPKDTDEDSALIFDLGDVREGERLHKEVSVYMCGLKQFQTQDGAKEILRRDSKARAFSISAQVEIPGFHGLRSDRTLSQSASISDLNGVLQFAHTPEQAPVIHFAGPWTIALQLKHPLRLNREAEVYLALTTPGLGPGTRVLTGYELVPENLTPKLEFVFPAAKPGDVPPKVVYELRGRC